MPGRKSRNKGVRGERDFLDALANHGIKGKRVPASGAGNDFKHDLVLPNGMWAEVKVRADGSGFGMLYRWLEQGANLLGIKRDRKNWLVVMPLVDFVVLYKRAIGREICAEAQKPSTPGTSSEST